MRLSPSLIITVIMWAGMHLGFHYLRLKLYWATSLQVCHFTRVHASTFILAVSICRSRHQPLIVRPRFSALWWTHDYTKNRCRPQRYKLEWNRLGRKREGWNPESRHDLYFCLFAIRLPIQYRWLCIHMAFCHFGRYRPILGFQIAALDSWEIGNSSLYLNVNI